MYFSLIYLIVPITYALVAVRIRRTSSYDPFSSCSFIRNASWSNNILIESCIWECVNEYDCQTAVFFQTDKICSLFKEECQKGYIRSSADDFTSVICYRKEHSNFLIYS